MSQINNISPNNPIQQIVNNPVQKQIPAEATQAPSDSVELSGLSNYMQILKTNDVRPAKIAAVRAQIEAGTYDADGSKLDAATNSLLDELNQM
jgi:anti-sigma28 factor (negative regulator of flagellin synthesis)